jgi:nucleoside-diphosphate kinase
MKTKTFAMVKPAWSQTYALSDVIRFIENRFFTIEELRLQRLGSYNIDQFYREHTGKHFYKAMAKYMCSGPVVGMILSLDDVYAFSSETKDGKIVLRTAGEGPPPSEPHEATAVYRWRHYLGATDSAKADPHSLRGLYGNKDGIMFQNVAHGSDGPEAATYEANLWGWCLGARDVYHDKKA